MDKKEVSLTNIFLLGMPGAGKDTNAVFIRNSHPNISAIISTGDIFRGASTPDGEYGRFYSRLKTCRDNVNNGGYIPDDIIVSIVNEVTSEMMVNNGISRFIFTGFPRTISQLNEIEKVSAQNHFLHLNCTIKNAKERINHRYEEDIKNGRDVREDDLPEKFSTRLNQYKTRTLPIINDLKIRGKIISIDTNCSIEEVAKKIKTRINF